METSLKIQMDVKNNAQELQNYILDMNNWEEEMKKKEMALNNERPRRNTIPPPRNKIKRNKSDNEKNHSNKPKRISAYDYSAWDKFDVEKACAEVDEDSDVREDQQQIYPESSTDQKGEKDLLNANQNLSLIDEAHYEKEMGNQFVKKEQWADAIKCYTNAINLHSSNAIYYANRSLCFLKLKNFKSAETDATTAIQLDKSYVKAYQRRALARLALRQLQEAKFDYQQILVIEPKNALAKAEINKIDEMLKNEQGVTESVKKATFEYKNIFKSEEIKSEGMGVLYKGKRKTPKNIDLLNSQKLSPKEGKKANKNVVTSKKDSSEPVTSEKNLNPEIKSQCDEKGDGDKRVPVQSVPQVFKSLPDWCKIVHPIVIPPHKRSKKLLRRIDITMKDEVADFAGDAKAIDTVPVTVPCDRVEKQKILHKFDQEEEFRLSFEVPKTAIQFQNCWKLIKKNPKECYSYLKKIPGRELVHIFENSLESSFFNELITFLANDDIEKEVEIMYDFLLGLSKVKRFKSLILFMSEAEKTCIKKCIGELKKAYSKEDIYELLTLYELKV